MTSARDQALIDDPAAAWDAAAPAWDDFVETGLDYWRTEVHGPALLEACGVIDGLNVLDLGCGQGWFSRQLAARGASVTGIDLSPRQLANARLHEAEHPLGVTYLQMDAAQIAEHWAPQSFDLVTACMVLHDTPHAGRVLDAARRVLRVDGQLAFSIVHPVGAAPHSTWDVNEAGEKGARRFDHYFESGPYILNWSMERLTTHWSTPQWHRTLAEWSALITEAGFVIAGLDEPRPTAEQTAHNPKLATATRIPFFLVVTLRPLS